MGEIRRLYHGKIAKIIEPKTLEFPAGCIRNVMIEFENGERVITNLKELKPIKHKSIDNFL